MPELKYLTLKLTLEAISLITLSVFLLGCPPNSENDKVYVPEISWQCTADDIEDCNQEINNLDIVAFASFNTNCEQLIDDIYENINNAFVDGIRGDSTLTCSGDENNGECESNITEYIFFDPIEDPTTQNVLAVIPFPADRIAIGDYVVLVGIDFNDDQLFDEDDTYYCRDDVKINNDYQPIPMSEENFLAHKIFVFE
jgi:hypothetical protein